MGHNPRASGLCPVQADKPWYNYRYYMRYILLSISFKIVHLYFRCCVSSMYTESLQTEQEAEEIFVTDQLECQLIGGQISFKPAQGTCIVILNVLVVNIELNKPK